MVALKMAQDEYTAMENELLKDKNSLKTKLREQELAHQEVVRQLKMVIDSRQYAVCSPKQYEVWI